MMEIIFKDKNLYPIQEKVFKNERLNFDDGLNLYKSNDIIGIGIIADYVRRKKHGNKAFFVYNQHINYTNICINNCLFCAFSKKKNEEGSYIYNIEDIKNILNDRIDEPIKELHIVGGINPELDINYYINILKTIKEIRSDAAIKAFTAVEIDHIAKISNMSLEKTIKTLIDAGLALVPGGGAEILNDIIWKKLFPKKISGDRWLEVVKQIHMTGLKSNATMLYGHIETLSQRVEHLIKLRQLQDITNGFSAFIPLAFHSKNTKMSELPSTTANDDLKNIAISRLMLDNFDHIKAYWIMIGEKLAQIGLSFGADDLDGTIIEEKITHTAGAKSAKGLTMEQLKYMIQSNGFEPIIRDSFYNEIK